MPHSKSRKTKTSLPLEVRILRAFHAQAMLHADDIAAVAVQCDPLPTPKEIKTILDKLVEKEWLLSLPDHWFVRVDESTQRSFFHIIPNKQEEQALKSISKIHFKVDSDLSNVAHYVLLVALQHPRQLTAWFDALIHYTRSEALNQKIFLWKDIATKAELYDADNVASEDEI